MRQRDEERTRQSLTLAERASEQSPRSHSPRTSCERFAAKSQTAANHRPCGTLRVQDGGSRACAPSALRRALAAGDKIRVVKAKQECAPAWGARVLVLKGSTVLLRCRNVGVERQRGARPGSVRFSSPSAGARRRLGTPSFCSVQRGFGLAPLWLG